MTYVLRGVEFRSLITLEIYFGLRQGAGKRMLENGEIEVK